MRSTSTDQTAIIVRVPAQPEPAGAAGPQSWTPSADDLPAEPEPLTNPSLTMLAWLVPVLVAGGIGSWHLGTPGLSEDELATWGMVSIGWDDFRSVLANVDATVGPYYALLSNGQAVMGRIRGRPRRDFAKAGGTATSGERPCQSTVGNTTVRPMALRRACLRGFVGHIPYVSCEA
jgi:hypothetical protein